MNNWHFTDEYVKAVYDACVASGIDYMDLYGRELVDIAIFVINGYLFCGQASSKVDMDVAVVGNGEAGIAKTVKMTDRKKTLARRYITKGESMMLAKLSAICSGDKSTFSDYESLAGPIPEEV